MPQLGILGTIIILQILLASLVVYALKRLLEKDLVTAALERVEVFRPSEEAKQTDKIMIVSAGNLSVDWRARFVAVLKDKCPRAEIEFLENALLRGGMVIEIAGEVMDYSLLTRLKYLFNRYEKKDPGNHPGL